MSAGPLLEVRDLVKHFPATRGLLSRREPATVRAVDGVSFELAKGESLGLVGETGSGKTTIARLVAGLLPATSGSIRLLGEEVQGASAARLRRLRREVQMVFQDPYSSLNPRKTAGSMVAAPLEIHGLAAGRAERRARVEELMERVGLSPEHYNRYPHEFSGGQRQRIGIARALALRPRLVLADEPVSALDVSIQAQILNLLRDLRRDLGLTLVLISHDLSVVRHMCDRVAVMHRGRIVELAESDRLYAEPQHEYTRTLLAAVPVPDPARAARRRHSAA